jgi:hypothetical protein
MLDTQVVQGAKDDLADLARVVAGAVAGARVISGAALAVARFRRHECDPRQGPRWIHEPTLATRECDGATRRQPSMAGGSTLGRVNAAGRIAMKTERTVNRHLALSPVRTR